MLLVSGRVLASKHPLRPYISNLHSPSGQAVEFDIALDDRGHWELNTDSAYFCWPVTVCVCVCVYVFFLFPLVCWLVIVFQWFIRLFVGAYFLGITQKEAQNFGVVSWAKSYQV